MSTRSVPGLCLMMTWSLELARYMMLPQNAMPIGLPLAKLRENGDDNLDTGLWMHEARIRSQAGVIKCGLMTDLACSAGTAVGDK